MIPMLQIGANIAARRRAREAAARCARAGWSAGSAILLARPGRAAKRYDFDDL